MEREQVLEELGELAWDDPVYGDIVGRFHIDYIGMSSFDREQLMMVLIKDATGNERCVWRSRSAGIGEVRLRPDEMEDVARVYVADFLARFACRVCGRIRAEPRCDAHGEPSWQGRCPCCGVEFGREDATVGEVGDFRKAWMSGGLQWFQPQETPERWTFGDQEEHIPEDFR